MKKVFVFLTCSLLCTSTLVSVSEHLAHNNRVFHRDTGKKTDSDRTYRGRNAKDVDGPLETRSRTAVSQYADEINIGPNKDKDKQHHWMARTRVKNTNPAFKGHYYHEVVFPYAPANTVMVVPRIVPGSGVTTRDYEGTISQMLPDPIDARGVVTTSVPYDVNISIDQCQAWATISGAPFSSQNPDPLHMTHVSSSSVPWWYDE